MKQRSLPFLFFTYLLLVVSSTYAQVIPELIFRNPVLESGTALKDGAKYRFKDAAKDLDAVVEVKRRSSSKVVINNIDLTSFGWDKAFQPELGIPGTVAPNQVWWVEFEISFFEAGTNKRKRVAAFDITSLDVDGDNVSIQEFVQFEKPKSVTYSAITNLVSGIPDAEIECGECFKSSVLEECSDCNGTGKDNSGQGKGNGTCDDCNGSGKLYSDCDHPWEGEINYNVQGPVLNFLNIDTLGTAVMATYHYENKDRFKLKIGAKSGAKSSTAGMRLNSIWHRAFNLSSLGLLPVKLTDFNAKYNKETAVLTWTTEQEITFSHFIVEKSLNGVDFKETAVVFAKDDGATVKEYSYTDDLSANKGTVYYRLKMVDGSQQVQNSVIRVIKVADPLADVKVQAYPNPVVNELRITVPTEWQNGTVTYDLYNASGKILQHLVSSNANQTETIKMNSLTPGIYILKVTSGNQTAIKQLMKSK
jgi:hypothetical protein